MNKCRIFLLVLSIIYLYISGAGVYAKEKLPVDEEKVYLEDIQELINKYNKIIEEKQKEKETELMEI